MTSPTASGTPTTEHASERRRERFHGLSGVVSGRAFDLQAKSVNRSSDAVARLARLRRAISTSPGAEPSVWDDTIGLVPEEELGRGDDPSYAETATHLAMALFSLHRQGKCTRAHSTGGSLGSATRILSHRRASDEKESEGVRRRFDAVLTAVDEAETAYHLRGIVMMLRDEQIPLDYGRLTTDLVDLWSPGRGDTVRLRWARDYRKAATGPGTTDEEQQ
jgi:CRISPR system Cascade subunit CasB